jgi:hypothetical protein
MTELTQVNSNFFSLIFYDFFFQFIILHKIIFSCALSIFTFFTVWLFREQVGKVNPDLLESFFDIFFIELWFSFLLGHHF